MKRVLLPLVLTAAACNSGGSGEMPDLTTSGGGNDFSMAGGADLSTGNDLSNGGADLSGTHPDLSGNPDLSAGPDLSSNPDLTVGPDFSVPVDMTMMPPDLTVVPDLTVPRDLTQPPDLMTPPDLAQLPPDMLALPPPSPVVTHVGVTGVTCCIQSNPKGSVVYLANITQDIANGGYQGDLHLYNGSSDTLLGSSVPVNGYNISPDGSTVLYLSGGGNGPGASALMLARTATPATQTTVIATGLDMVYGTFGYYTPSGKYFLAAVSAAGVANSKDLHIIDVVAGTDKIQYDNGAFDYLEAVTADDTMLFQNLKGGTSTGTGGVQTLFRVSLPAVSGLDPAATQIDTHSANIFLTLDDSTLYYTKTAGGLYSYNLAVGNIALISASAISVAVGPQAAGPVAYLQTDGSVHVYSSGSVVYSSAPGAADLFSPIYFTDDAAHIFFFKNVNTQNNQGDLYHVALPPAAVNTPQLVSTGAAINQVRPTTPGKLAIVNALDVPGTFGTLQSINYDGTGAMTLAPTKVATGEIFVVQPSAGVRIANLMNAALDATASHVPVTGVFPITGALGYTGSDTTAESSLDTAVHMGSFEFSDDLLFLIYAGGAAWNATAINYVGTLKIYDAPAGTTATTTLTGVSEVAPVSKRSLFVNAPTAATAGVYKVTY
jgi:hypothetical protein